jgi:thiol-disulfide isomerase/thioredoxin
MKLIRPCLFAALLLVALAAPPAVAGEVVQVNRGSEGQVINPKSLIVPGHPVVVEFFSEFCPPCRAWPG